MRQAVKARASLMATVVLLSSCGGDGASSGTGSASAVATPAATPTPTPTPGYAVATDFTRDRSFNAVGMRILLRPPYADNGNADFYTESTSIGLDFMATSRVYRVRYNDESLTVTAATQVDTPYPYDTWFDAQTKYVRSPLQIGSDTSGNALPSTYSGYSLWDTYYGSYEYLRYMIFGARTVASDIPTSGKRTFNGIVSIRSTGRPLGIGTPTQNSYPVAITVDFANRTVSGSASITVSGSTEPQPIAFSGSLDASTGRIYSPANFEGALYGRAGAELALLFRQSGQVIYYGYVAAR